MKELKPWLIVTALSYLLFLIWSLPADRALSLMTGKGLVANRVALTTAPRGSWHHGQLTAVRFGSFEIAEFNWQLQPAALLLGRLQFAIETVLPGGNCSGLLQLGPASMTIKKLQGELPAAILARTLPGFELGGELLAENISLTFEDGLLEKVSGRARWNEAALGSPYNLALGGLVVVLDNDATGNRARISDTGGPLQAGIIGRLAPDGNYVFDGIISARAGSPPDLATFLNIFGSPGSDGLIRVSFNGHLPVSN